MCIVLNAGGATFRGLVGAAAEAPDGRAAGRAAAAGAGALRRRRGRVAGGVRRARRVARVPEHQLHPRPVELRQLLGIRRRGGHLGPRVHRERRQIQDGAVRRRPARLAAARAAWGVRPGPRPSPPGPALKSQPLLAFPCAHLIPDSIIATSLCNHYIGLRV